MRERLLDANGRAENHVSWVTEPGPASAASQVEALAAMDAWLTARQEVAAAHPDLDAETLTLASRPENLADGCVTPGGERIAERLSLDPDTACNELFPYHATPRMQAGGPASNVVIACGLTDLDPDDYGVTFTDEQWERLEAGFPDGRCDWTQAGRGQVPMSGTWLRF